MNERDTLKHQIYFDRSYNEVEKNELESQLNKVKEELSREEKMSRDKVARLEEVYLFSFQFVFFFPLKF